MKILSCLVLGLLLSATVVAAAAPGRCTSVVEVKSNPAGYTAGPIRIRAFLVSTHHGAYLVDQADGSDVLGVSFSTAGPHADTANALLEKLRFAGLGKPFAEIQSVFEGQLTADRGSGRLHFEIYSEIYGPDENKESNTQPPRKE